MIIKPPVHVARTPALRRQGGSPALAHFATSHPNLLLALWAVPVFGCHWGTPFETLGPLSGSIRCTDERAGCSREFPSYSGIPAPSIRVNPRGRLLDGTVRIGAMTRCCEFRVATLARSWSSFRISLGRRGLMLRSIRNLSRAEHLLGSESRLCPGRCMCPGRCS